MKVCIIQPPYSTDYSKSEEYLKTEIELLDRCDETMDIIVMPESCDIPCLARTREERDKSVEKYNEIILNKAIETAKRCHSMLFINIRYKTDIGYRNTTYAIDRNGEIQGYYFKSHPTPGEVAAPEQDTDYSFVSSPPTVIEMEGIRFGFLTCYDFYFYENFPNIARQNIDIIIGCSHQRSDTHEALEIITRFLAYNTNSYVLRSSVSMDENSDIGGASMIVAPDGKVLANLYSRIGIATAEIDINKKYFKPAGFGNPDSAHYEYVEKGRRPWLYRPAGSAIVLPDDIMPYPRICAHKGFIGFGPENSLPAFGAAIASGAHEIEFNIDKKDIPKFENILKKFSCHAIMNIHILCSEPKFLEKMISLINVYDCRKYIYFTCDDEKTLASVNEIAPDICRCYNVTTNFRDAVDTAEKYNCKKLQFSYPHFNREIIENAHLGNIRCNILLHNNSADVKELLDIGFDTVVTNNYDDISKVTE